MFILFLKHHTRKSGGNISLREGSFSLHEFLAGKYIRDESEESGVPVLKRMLSPIHGEKSNFLLHKRNLKKILRLTRGKDAKSNSCAGCEKALLRKGKTHPAPSPSLKPKKEALFHRPAYREKHPFADYERKFSFPRTVCGEFLSQLLSPVKLFLERGWKRVRFRSSILFGKCPLPYEQYRQSRTGEELNRAKGLGKKILTREIEKIKFLLHFCPPMKVFLQF